MNINDKIRIEPIWDYKNGRRFQIILVNRVKDEHFTVHNDTMARSYVKLKLTDSDVFQLIQELQKSIQSIDFDPKIVEARSERTRLKIVKEEETE